MKILFNNTVAQIWGMDDKTYNDLKYAYTTFVPGAMYFKSKSKHWNGQVHLVKDYTFPTGLLPDILSYLQEKGITPDLIDSRGNIKPSFKPTTVNLRPYQKDVINSILKNECNNLWWPRGVLRLATGAGKTEIAVALTEIMNVPSLFLCHRKHLVSQAIERYKKYGFDAGIVASGKKEVHKDIVVATIQTLYSMLKNNDPDFQVLVNKTKQIFFDEAHLLAANYKDGNALVKVSNMFVNSPYRWGLTATPFLKDVYSNYLLKGATGNQIYEIKSQELISQGYLSNISIEIKDLKQQTLPSIGTSWMDEYAHGIVLNKERNQAIIDYMKKVPKPCLALVDQIGHGDSLYYMARNIGLDLEFVNGEDLNTRRLELINKLNTGGLDILLASTIFDEGVDIPEIRSVILCGGKKSPIKLLQRIGRGLRKSSTKQGVVIIDFYDRMFESLKRQTKQRIKVFDDEGFSKSIV